MVNKNASVQWLLRNGDRAVERHVLNLRLVGGHNETVLQKILDKGVMTQYRGRVVLMNVEGHEGKFKCVGGGTLVDAFYIANQQHGTNPNVVLSLQTGLGECVLMHAQTPTDVLQHIIVEHNSFHDGISLFRIIVC